MKVLLARADNGGCAFYRMQEPARVVSALDPNVDVRVVTDLDVNAERDRYTGQFTVHEIREDVDLLVVQRPLGQGMGAVLAQARRQGIATIVELDDDLERLEAGNRAWHYVQPRNNPNENYEWLKKAAIEADLLTVSTIALGRFNPRSHVVIPNFVPASLLDLQRGPRPDLVTVGWTGTLQTHPDDLESARGKIAQAVWDHEAGFFTVGDGVGVQHALGLSRDTPFGATGWLPLEDYHQTIIDTIDIGVVPLADNAFNRAKSRLKGLEMAALGIPFVATDVADYQRLAAAGVGKTASRANDFYRELSRWLSDDTRREADGQRYRELVREHHTYEGNAHRWLDAWQQAIDIRKASK